jgi:polyphosphate kinase 2 (PPK2 family)
MDSAGKDSTIAHVMSGVDPKGCEVKSFTAPSEEDLNHDYLWRAGARPYRHLSPTHYEEVLVPRVIRRSSPDKVPRELVSNRIWEDRFEDINAEERYLSRNDVGVRKFFLHVSKINSASVSSTARRCGEKLEVLGSRGGGEKTMGRMPRKGYEEIIRATATEQAPWLCGTGRPQWSTRMVVALAIVETLEGLDLRLPPVDARRRAEL